MDHAHATLQRLAGAVVDDRLAAEADRAAVGAVHPSKDLHQRRFASAVLADHCVHFAGVQLEVDTLQRLHAGKCLADAAHLHQRLLATWGHCDFSTGQRRLAIQIQAGQRTRSGSERGSRPSQALDHQSDAPCGPPMYDWTIHMFFMLVDSRRVQVRFMLPALAFSTAVRPSAVPTYQRASTSSCSASTCDKGSRSPVMMLTTPAGTSLVSST